MSEPPARTIMTVTGPVDPADIGPTLMHEHIFVDLAATFAPVDDPELVRYRDAPVSDELIELLRVWPFSLTVHNGRLDDEPLAVEEVGAFAASGGSLLVDCTLDGIGRDPAALPPVAEKTGVQIVQGTGFYVELTHPPFVEAATVEELAERFVEELTMGIGETGVRAGIIGEIGTSGIDRDSRQKRGDVTPAEEKVLRAAAAASMQTGAAITVHLDPRGTGAYRVIEILAGEGVDPDRMIMGHMDANPDADYHLRVADTGVFVEYDHFGREYYAGHFGRSYTSDARRIELLCMLIERGFTNRLLVSQDVCAKIDLHRYGGNGYDHITRRIVPELRSRGLDDEVVHALLVDNPRRALAF